ncbi:3-keto-5-aminohexanoate cleavage protein [uncultured Litoreibacter sp.]|uniref:3-keto-5-aminohexanoate cleavage protein n=1 Tax=uncultured Litoreibacter sp. TaxID=1392394 RepID=UPI002636534D|nr:3-keto-5-aminohexanoate cleavage protein [uncultured Litoreibacter sp.]
MSKTFITCAITGAGDGPKRSPLVPVTPEEIADSALAAAIAGAAIVHLHVRDPDTGEGSRDNDLYRQVVERIRDRNRDVIINLTAGMGGDAVFGGDDPLPLQNGTDLIGPTERLSHVKKLRPDICTLDCGSYNVGDGNLVYVSTSDYIRVGAKRIRQLGVRPELEVFDLGHLRYSLKLLRDGVFDAPTMIQFCLGVPYGAPADTAAMKMMADMVREHDVIWSAFGVGRDQLRMVAQAVLLGGHVRVGLEDNLYLKRGVPARNEQLVTKAAEIIDTLGGAVMSPEETRDLLRMERS